MITRPSRMKRNKKRVCQRKGHDWRMVTKMDNIFGQGKICARCGKKKGIRDMQKAIDALKMRQSLKNEN